MSNASSIPQKVRPIHDSIAERIESICRAHLNEEYRELCLRMLGVLARKRPSPLLSGKPEAWACGIVRAVGYVNFLDDKTQTPHLKSKEIDAYFGVSTGTGQSRSKRIRDMLKTYPFDPEWSRPSMIDRNPVAWLINVNGMVVDARYVPLEIQIEAYRRGLIPYIPGEVGEEPADGDD